MKYNVNLNKVEYSKNPKLCFTIKNRDKKKTTAIFSLTQKKDFLKKTLKEFNYMYKSNIRLDLYKVWLLFRF